MNTMLKTAIVDAVDMVNSHAGQTRVLMRFVDDPTGYDFIANAARIHGGLFEFQAGFDSYSGSLDELSEIKAELIKR